MYYDIVYDCLTIKTLYVYWRLLLQNIVVVGQWSQDSKEKKKRGNLTKVPKIIVLFWSNKSNYWTIPSLKGKLVSWWWWSKLLEIIKYYVDRKKTYQKMPDLEK